ncbi:MAG: methyltransferase domain-containing protein [Gammaproteobacteria bacterium]|nr:methyltransferase domain-containing protein [Gammaproteobacteria bacterium]
MNAQVDSVLERYSQGAKERQAALCCPVSYDAGLLALLPQEIIEKDYGCGDPSRYVREGDVVLDLGSGGGKICYMAAQLVGSEGRVIGVDMNDDMLALARKYQPEMAAKLGGDRVRFVKGRIEELALDVEALEVYYNTHPDCSVAELTAWQDEQRRTCPLIPDDSVDVVISNCVLNLVDDAHKQQMMREIFRVLKPGGRVAISDIVSDEPIPQHLKINPELWSGCISGAFQEQEFIHSFAAAGFLAVQYDKWDAAPWQEVEGIEFRSVTLTAVKGAGTECLDYGHAVIYRGPYASVTDDEGHVYLRGERMAVCERTYRLLTEGPYRGHFIGITPRVLREPVTWCAPAGTKRPAAETKGGVHAEACAPTGCC